jgi:hypothetical protein
VKSFYRVNRSKVPVFNVCKRFTSAGLLMHGD